MAVKKPSWFTTVVNRLPTARSFGYLGQYGKVLKPARSLTFPGDLWSMLADRRTSLDALKRDCSANRISLLLTPAPLSKPVRKLGYPDPDWAS